jgi:hypothetical protein
LSARISRARAEYEEGDTGMRARPAISPLADSPSLRTAKNRLQYSQRYQRSCGCDPSTVAGWVFVESHRIHLGKSDDMKALPQAE